MTVFSLLMSIVFLVVALESASVEVDTVPLALEEIEAQRGPLAALAVALHMLGGGEWWEI